MSPQSGNQVTVSWNDADIGNLAASGSWADHVFVLNQTTGVTLYTADVPYSSGAIQPGASSTAQSTTFQLPDGAAGVGNVLVTVTADQNQAESEYPNPGTGASASTSFASTLAPYPDLVVNGLTVLPGSPQSGQSLTINWNDTNTGNAPISKSFYDQIVITNTSTGQNLLSTTSYYNEAANGSIGASGTAAQSFTFTLPNGAPGIGNIQVVINADVYGQVFQVASTSGRTASTKVASTAAPYPDLQVANLAVAPSSNILSGDTLTISWNDANNGNGSVTGAYTDSLTIVNTTTGQTLLSTSLPYNSAADGQIVAGSSFAQTYQFQLPQGSAGVGQISAQVTVNANGGEFEYNSQGTANTNNTASTTVSSTLVHIRSLRCRTSRHRQLSIRAKRPRSIGRWQTPEPQRPLAVGANRSTSARTRLATISLCSPVPPTLDLSRLEARRLARHKSVYPRRCWAISGS